MTTVIRCDKAWSDDERARYARDGFVVVEGLVDGAFARRLRERYPALFAGRFETGIEPDIIPQLYAETDTSPKTRWMTNAWRGDYAAAVIALDATIGRLIAEMNGWSGMRLLQDNIHWKPPGSPELSYHQDNSYHLWCDPPELSSCWIALGDVRAETGTVAYVRGSHLWPRIEIHEYEDRVHQRNLKGFLDPKDARAHVMVAAENAGVEPEFVPIEMKAGSAVFFNGWVWHGSFANTSRDHRTSISIHGLRAEARFHPTILSPTWSRYKRFGDTAMDESVFPILWHENGYRTGWLDDYRRQGDAFAA
jgi:ectoine hydroxylase-related dioxygenase (phytanoyl-CoA dioxygenase family)